MEYERERTANDRAAALEAKFDPDDDISANDNRNKPENSQQ